MKVLAWCGAVAGVSAAAVLAAWTLPGHAGVRLCKGPDGRVTYQDLHCTGASVPVTPQAATAPTPPQAAARPAPAAPQAAAPQAAARAAPAETARPAAVAAAPAAAPVDRVMIATPVVPGGTAAEAATANPRPAERSAKAAPDAARRDLRALPAHGSWRGAAQFRYLSGAPTDASADLDIELELLGDGKLQGAARGAGCRLDGVYAPDERLRHVVSVDINVSGCRDVRFNARFGGLIDATPGRSRLRLQAITAGMPVANDGVLELSMATIDASLRR